MAAIVPPKKQRPVPIEARPFETVPNDHLVMLLDSLKYTRGQSSENRKTRAERSLLIAQIEIEQETRDEEFREIKKAVEDNIASMQVLPPPQAPESPKDYQ